jgi:hypothetical protein
MRYKIINNILKYCNFLNFVTYIFLTKNHLLLNIIPLFHLVFTLDLVN